MNLDYCLKIGGVTFLAVTAYNTVFKNMNCSMLGNRRKYH
jgi:hypothetical protein